MADVRNCDVVTIRDSIPGPYTDRQQDDLTQAEPTPDRDSIWAASGNGDTTDPMLGRMFRGRPTRLLGPRVGQKVRSHPQGMQRMTGGRLSGLGADVVQSVAANPLLIGVAVGLVYLLVRNRKG